MTFDKKTYQQQYYQDRKEEFNDRVKARRRLLLRISDELKLAPCMDCGVQYPSYVMDFDHRPGVDKKFNISDFRSVSSVKVFLEEIDKCDLVCANCHRIRTFTRV